MDTILIVSITIFSIFMFLILLGAVIFLFWYKAQKEYPNRMCLRVHNGGKSVVINNVRWKFFLSKRYGEIIIAKHKGKQIPMPRFDNRWLLPLAGANSLFCDVTSKDGYYYVNEIKNLQKSLGDDGIKKLLEEKYEIVNYETEPFKEMINPIAHEDRSAILMNQQMLQELVKENTPWWQNPFVAFLAPVFFGALVGIVLAALGYQFGGNLLSAAQPAVETAGSNIASSIADTIAGGTPPQ